MDGLFKGIADPVRRQILELLSRQPLNVNQINEHFGDISRQAVSKHRRYWKKRDGSKYTRLGGSVTAT
ncbi:helix-turn-helix domain-containing protein [Chitinophaga sedimenti]|uniref:ArsR/SmtB family transcription factor n=1 Tax=Chitinophaga sedimenti TaxID=2033606 RepID=UPI002003A60C|nr:helix-turn-helix domain-containing protein [Chitinophaga sedimenti]MCK7556393.1 helix-turn-helix domain-containing protein [Chitinophaga sedimenti]